MNDGKFRVEIIVVKNNKLVEINDKVLNPRNESMKGKNTRDNVTCPSHFALN